jgi:hypothetical protein
MKNSKKVCKLLQLRKKKTLLLSWAYHLKEFPSLSNLEPNVYHSNYFYNVPSMLSFGPLFLLLILSQIQFVKAIEAASMTNSKNSKKLRTDMSCLKYDIKIKPCLIKNNHKNKITRKTPRAPPIFEIKLTIVT